jgi:hypothetical protein
VVSQYRRRLEALWDDVPEGQELPVFEGTRLINGAVEVACGNEFLAIWLADATERMGYFEGSIRKCVDADFVIKRKSAMIWVPGPGKPETKILLERLKRVNPRLQTSLWRTYERGEPPNGSRFILGVDEPSAEFITDASFRRSIGLQ